MNCRWQSAGNGIGGARGAIWTQMKERGRAGLSAMSTPLIEKVSSAYQHYAPSHLKTAVAVGKSLGEYYLIPCVIATCNGAMSEIEAMPGRFRKVMKEGASELQKAVEVGGRIGREYLLSPLETSGSLIRAYSHFMNLPVNQSVDTSQMTGLERERMENLDSELFQRAGERFGPVAAKQLAALAKAGGRETCEYLRSLSQPSGPKKEGIWEGVTRGVTALLSAPFKAVVGLHERQLDRVYKTLSFEGAEWAAGKLQTTFSSEEAKQRVADATAKDLAKVSRTIKHAAQYARSTTQQRWGEPEFDRKLATLLLPGQTRNGKVDKRLKERFCKDLAHRICVKLSKEMVGSNTRLAQSFQVLRDLGGGQTPPLHHLEKQVTSLLMVAYDQLTDPVRLKEWLALTLEATSQAMESTYTEFMRTGKPVPPEEAPREFEKAYGTTLIDLLLALEPVTLNGQIPLLWPYKKLYGKALKEGSDFLTVLLRDSVGQVTQELMAPNTDQWIASLIKIAYECQVTLREGAGEENRHFAIDNRPPFISEQEWEDIKDDPEKVAALINPQSDDEKAKVAQLKARHIEQIDARFTKVSQSLAKGVYRAGLVMEQFQPSCWDRARDPTRSLVARGWYAVRAVLYSIGFVKSITDFVVYWKIQLCAWIADRFGEQTGEQLGQDLKHFISAPIGEYLLLNTAQKALERLGLAATDAELAEYQAAERGSSPPQQPVEEARRRPRSRSVPAAEVPPPAPRPRSRSSTAGPAPASARRHRSPPSSA